MEVGQAVLALDLVDTELDLAESVVLIVLEIGEGNLNDTALQGVVGVLQTTGAVDKGLADTSELPLAHAQTYTRPHNPNDRIESAENGGGGPTRGSGRSKEPVKN